jgi:hypothetical protein
LPRAAVRADKEPSTIPQSALEVIAAEPDFEQLPTTAGFYGSRRARMGPGLAAMRVEPEPGGLDRGFEQ